MTELALTFRNGRIFDGERLLSGHAARFEGDRLVAIEPDRESASAGATVDLAGDIVSPGYVDLQVNGGGGIMFNDAPSVATLRRIAAAHRRLGVAALLPTLITATPGKTAAAISAAVEAVRTGVAGIAGLHLEGPHLSLARKGAHDPGLIRPMTPDDLRMLIAAKETLPALMVTVAPENVSADQVARLAAAGIIVSLGHTDADFATCARYADAGARCVTHLFNAMSQLGNREPGLVGTALADGRLSAGLIADAIHVHPATMRAAWAAKTGPGRIFLVSDAMAVAGTDRASFDLDGREVRRRQGRLTLADGTLAGADLDPTQAIRTLVERVGVPLEAALQAAITVPAAILAGGNGASPASARALGGMIRIAHDLRSVRPLASGIGPSRREEASGGDRR